MVIDGNRLPAGEELETDLCIVGSGPAGITIASELAGRPMRVLLVEAGSFEYDQQAQERYRAESMIYEPYDMRLSMFGGSSNHWGGVARPLDEIDFEPRPWIPHSGWPIRRADLDPYYPRAAELIEIGAIEPDPALWARRVGARLLPLDEEGSLGHMMFQISPPTSFGEVYRHALLTQSNLTICLRGVAVGYELHRDQPLLERLEFRNWAGGRFTVKAKCFVLACGGIENPRLLLLWQRRDDGGVFRQNDLVGRFFMEHPHFHLGRVVLEEPSFPARLYLRQLAAPDRRMVNAHIHANRQAQERERLPNVAIQLRPRVPSKGERALLRLLDDLRQRRYPDDLGTKIQQVLIDIGEVSGVAMRKASRSLFGIELHEGGEFAIRSVGEQLPDPDSRVTLSDHLQDSFGLAQAKVTWRLSEIERQSMGRFAKMLAREFGRQGIGRMQIAFDADGDETPDRLQWVGHQIGTTRMADDPAQGVVDRQCRLHGVANLYLAGSSVFCTSGAATPTLTIVALAARLADHLKNRVFV
jgi:choline dehydrogenase-like flavoprotein